MTHFVGSSQQRYSFPPMSREQRRVVHEMAAAFGLATQSFGGDSTRHIQLFKVQLRRSAVRSNQQATPEQQKNHARSSCRAGNLSCPARPSRELQLG